jgi:hypothetical protein
VVDRSAVAAILAVHSGRYPADHTAIPFPVDRAVPHPHWATYGWARVAVVHQATRKRNVTGGLSSNQFWQADVVPGTTVEHKDSETFACGCQKVGR